VVVEAPFSIGSRHETNRSSSTSANVLIENNKTKSNGTRPTLNNQLSLQANQSVYAWDNKSKKKQRENSKNFSNQNNPQPRKPGRPKRDVKILLDFFFRIFFFIFSHRNIF
jgi:hypothetical protein